MRSIGRMVLDLGKLTVAELQRLNAALLSEAKRRHAERPSDRDRIAG